MRPQIRHIIFWVLLLSVLLGSISYAQNQAQGQPQEGAPWYEDLLDSKFIYAILLMFGASSVVWLIDLFRKDRILKTLLSKYVVILTSGNPKRITGKFRLEKGGIEIFSEESRLRGQAPSYIFEASEIGAFEAFIRYHDEMTERERAERDADFESTYHPRALKRLGRGMRNFSHEMRDQFKKTFETVWGRIRQSTFMQNIQQYEKTTGTSLDQIQRETFAAAMDVQYDRLIDRLVGTKVLVDALDKRYSAVLKDYTSAKGGYMYLMDLLDGKGRGFEETWSIMIDIEHGKRAARDARNAIRARIEGDTLILENYANYAVYVPKLHYQGGPGDQVPEPKQTIEPFGELRRHLRPGPQRHSVGGLGRVFTETPLSYRNFKKLQIDFVSHRSADVVFPRSKCKIKERAEKYQPTVLDLGSFTDVVIHDVKRTEEMVIADKDGKPVEGVHLIHGYVTNINEDRIDIKEVDTAYSKRWSVEHMFGTLDNKLRKIAPVKTDLLPPVRRRMVTQALLAIDVSPQPQLRAPIAQPLYTPVWFNGRFPRKQKPILPVKLLMLAGNTTRFEYPMLQAVPHVLRHRLITRETNDLRLPMIEKAHILWIGYGEIFHNGYRFTIDTEQRVRNFAHKGGVVIVSGQDMRNNKRPTARWTPELVSGVERNETHDFDPTFAGRHLFSRPHEIEPNQPIFDDAWTEWGSDYEVLATINGGQDAGFLMLEYGAGLYLLTSLRNASREDAQANAPIMENLLCYGVEWIDDQKRTDLYLGSVV